MAPPSRSRPADRALTLTERARRAQLIEVAVDVVAEHGYAGASLSRLAEGAGVTKAAVLYHYPSKDALLVAAYRHVVGTLADRIAAAIEAAEPADGPAAYIRTLIGHLREHPRHTRTIIEAVSHDAFDEDRSSRWRDLARILDAARRARGGSGRGELRTAAIAVGGAIDAIVGEQLEDPDYDTAAAAEELVGYVQRLLGA